MREPADRPLVQQRVAVVIARQMRRVRGQRPGVEDGQCNEQRKARGTGMKSSRLDNGPGAPIHLPAPNQPERNQGGSRQPPEDQRERDLPVRKASGRQHPPRHVFQLGAVALPRPAHLIGTASLYVFEQHEMRSALEADASRLGCGGVRAAVIDDQLAVDLQRRAIIGSQRKCVVACEGIGQVAEPSSAERRRWRSTPISRDAGGRDFRGHELDRARRVPLIACKVLSRESARSTEHSPQANGGARQNQQQDQRGNRTGTGSDQAQVLGHCSAHRALRNASTKRPTGSSAWSFTGRRRVSLEIHAPAPLAAGCPCASAMEMFTF